MYISWIKGVEVDGKLGVELGNGEIGRGIRKRGIKGVELGGKPKEVSHINILNY